MSPAEETKMKASHKKTRWGYKALVRRDSGSTHIPTSRIFPSAEAARIYAQTWIDTNRARVETAARASIERRLAGWKLRDASDA